MPRVRNENHPLIQPSLLRGAHALRDARVRRGLSQRELAERLGVTTTTVARYELGFRGIPLELLGRAAEILSAPALVAIARALPGNGELLSTADAARYDIERFFTSKAFFRWWVERSMELCDSYDCEPPEIETLRQLVVDLVTRLHVWTQALDPVINESAALEACDLVMGLVRAKLAARAQPSAAA